MKRRYQTYLRTIISPQGLAVIASGILAVLAVLGFIFSPADGVILGIMCLLTASFMQNKQSDESFHRKLVSIAENHQAATDALIHLDDLPSFPTRISHAEEVWVSGLTLSSFLVLHRILLRSFVANGGRFRILIAPVNGHIADEAFRYFPKEMPLYVSGMRISRDIIAEIRSGHEGQVDARVLPVFPSHLLLLINPKRSDAEVQVHLNIYHGTREANPLLVIHREESASSYDIFMSEFESLWESGNSFDYSNPGSKTP